MNFQPEKILKKMEHIEKRQAELNDKNLDISRARRIRINIELDDLANQHRKLGKQLKQYDYLEQ